jgi:DNA-binding CsgD family transcriptional regulator/Tfp pilus assembly protein PilF
MNTKQIKEGNSVSITLKNTTTINSINFTCREIDVIACILGGRSPKKIASFLSIAPRTVEIHIRNIMLKIGCNSRESIIDFIEKSNTLEKFKKHYLSLLVNLAFIKELKKISVSAKEKNINCLIFHYKTQKTKGVINDLEDHLRLIGIKVISKIWEKDKTNTFIDSNIKTGQSNYVIYFIDNEFIERLQGIENKIIEEVQDLKYNFKDISIPIFLSLDDDNTKKLYEKSSDLSYVKLLVSENYYFLFFELLKSLLFSQSIDKYFIEFKKQYESFSNVSLLKKLIESNELQKISDIINISVLIKKIYPKWLILSLICFCFVIYNVNGGIEVLNKKSHGTVPVVANKTYQEIKEPTNKITSWNLPRQDHVFIGREDLLNKLHAKLHFQYKLNPAEIFMISVCAGLGGIGKTQLASQYVHNTKYHYTFRAWFTAHNIDQLKQQYIELAKVLGYRDENPSIKTALSYIKEWLANNPGWLLVYDNVNNYEEIKEFLPENGGSIILTTRQQNWPNRFKVLDIQVMTEAESIALIQSLIKRKILETEKKSVKELVKTLGYLPLALSQAGSYIHQTQITITDYLNLYKVHEQEFLSDNTLPEGTNSLPVAITWNITLKAIVKEAKSLNQPPLEIALLSACAYLAPERIPFNLLLIWLKKAYPHLVSPELVLPKLVSRLWQYSMLHYEENGDITIHRLVQSVVRHHHQRLKREGIEYPQPTSKWYINLIDATHVEYCLETKSAENAICKTKLLPHLQAIVSNYALWANKVPKFSLGNILDDIGSIFYQNNDPKSAKIYHQDALINNKQRYGEKHLMFSKSLINLAIDFGALGDAKQSKTLLEKALKINEKKYGNDHIGIANILAILGLAYADLGNVKSSMKVLEHALKIMEKHYDKNHLKISEVLTELGVIYLALGNTIKSKNYLEHAVCIQEQYNGKNDTHLAKALGNLGRGYIYLQNSNEAIINLERAISIFKTYSRENSVTQATVEIAKSFTALAVAYIKLNDPTYAKKLLEKALEIKLKYFDTETHHQIARTLINLSITNLVLGNIKESINLSERSLKIFLENYGKLHFSVAIALSVLGNAYVSLGDIERGKMYLNKALNVKKELFGNNHRETAITLHYLIKAHIHNEKFASADAFMQKYLSTFIHNYGNQQDYTKHIAIVEQLLGMPMLEYVKKNGYLEDYNPALFEFARF